LSVSCGGYRPLSVGWRHLMVHVRWCVRTHDTRTHHRTRTHAKGGVVR
jgi:hypothetical protein